MRKLLLLFTLLFATAVQAQKDLHVKEIFDGNLVKKIYATENIVKGAQLKPYKLTFFRSIKFKATAEERKTIEKLVREDIKNSRDLEQEQEQEKEGEKHIKYAIMTLPDKKNSMTKQYLCYQCAPHKTEFAITLVYMEGTATLPELQKTFKKQ